MPVDGAIGEPSPIAQKRLCPRCREPWVRWKGSRLLCHAKCVFTLEERAEMLRMLDENPRGGVRMLAEKFGAPETVIRSALHYAKRDRRSA